MAGGGVGGEGMKRCVLYDFLGGRNIIRDPRTLSLYHSMLSCTFATLAILNVCVSFVNQKLTLS